MSPAQVAGSGADAKLLADAEAVPVTRICGAIPAVEKVAKVDDGMYPAYSVPMPIVTSPHKAEGVTSGAVVIVDGFVVIAVARPENCVGAVTTT